MRPGRVCRHHCTARASAMYTKLILLGVVYLALFQMTVTQDQSKKGKRGGGGGGGRFAALKKCCPTFPLILKEESIKSCVATMKANRPSAAATAEQGGGPDEAEEVAEGTESNESGAQRGRGKKGKGRGDRANRGCMMECAFKADGLTVTGDNGKEKMNMEALNAQLKTLAVGEWAPVISSAQELCTVNAPIVRPGMNCTSGANKVARCLMRHMFTNCPSLENTDSCKQRQEKMKNVRKGRGGRNGGRGGQNSNKGDVEPVGQDASDNKDDA